MTMNGDAHVNAPTNFTPVASAERLVVIGNGMAGCRAVEEILARDPARYAITIFGAEPRVNYNRIMLSPVLAGEKAFDEIVINTAAWYDDNGITLVSGDPVVKIDRASRTVIARSGRVEPYDKLLIATGSDPFIIPVPGSRLPGVVTFRDLDDVDKMLAAAQKGGSAVVIGGGLLGLEAAHGLTLQGMTVTVIHLMPTLMERQLDEAAGFLLKTELERRGQVILTGADTAEIVEKDGHVAAVKLKDGREIPRQGGGPGGRARDHGRRSHGHVRPRRARGRRMRPASRAVLRPRRAAVGHVPCIGGSRHGQPDGLHRIGNLNQT
jgi:nitrite reductase (NADH) large subunit